MGSPTRYAACLLGEIQFHAFRCPDQMRFQAVLSVIVITVADTAHVRKGMPL